MIELKKLFEKRDRPFDPIDSRILCFPHVINICVQHTIKKMTDIELVDSEEETDALGEVEVGRRDPIALGRVIVSKIRASGKRQDAFESNIIAGNNMGWFMHGDNVVKIPNLQLLRDVRTRWDSTYQMIRRLRELRPVSKFLVSSSFFVNSC
jgi:hypothetical protein